MFSKKFLTTSLLSFLLLNFLLAFLPALIQVNAQIQDVGFSGNDAASYQCIGNDGKINPSLVPYQENGTGSFLCPGVDRDGNGKDDKAILKPPALQQIEIWFVRIVYVIWALVGTYSFILLVYLGYQYMLRGGTSDTQLVELRKRIIYYVIGFSLVFLAIPILSTFFRLLNINTQVDCYNVNMPGFQFFYASLCTDPNSLADPCSGTLGDAVGKACPTPGRSNGCYFGAQLVCYKCIDDINVSTYQTWQFGDGCQ